MALSVAKDTPKSIEKQPKKALKANKIPVAKYHGYLNLLDMDISCYVLDDG